MFLKEEIIMKIVKGILLVGAGIALTSTAYYKGFLSGCVNGYKFGTIAQAFKDAKVVEGYECSNNDEKSKK